MKKYTRAILCVLLIVSLLLLVVPFLKPFHLPEDPGTGKPVLVEEDQEYFSWIDDFCVRDGYLYVYYGHGLSGILKVYDTEGNFIRTYVTSLRAEPNLYITDRCAVLGSEQAGGYYFFSEGEFESFCEVKGKEDGEKIRETFLKKTEGKKTDSWEYEKKGISIVRRDAGGNTETVLQRPFYLYLVSGIPMSAVYLVVAFACFFILRRNKPRDEEEESETSAEA